MVQCLNFCMGKVCDVAKYVRSCQTCQRTKAAHGEPKLTPQSPAAAVQALW